MASLTYECHIVLREVTTSKYSRDASGSQLGHLVRFLEHSSEEVVTHRVHPREHVMQHRVPLKKVGLVSFLVQGDLLGWTRLILRPPQTEHRVRIGNVLGCVKQLVDSYLFDRW